MPETKFHTHTKQQADEVNSAVKLRTCVHEASEGPEVSNPNQRSE